MTESFLSEWLYFVFIIKGNRKQINTALSLENAERTKEIMKKYGNDAYIAYGLKETSKNEVSFLFKEGKYDLDSLLMVIGIEPFKLWVAKSFKTTIDKVKIDAAD
jgi:hypothetical protein